MVSVAGIAAEVDNNRQESVMKLAHAHDVPAKALKKLARWAIKLLCEEMRKDRLKLCQAITAMIAAAF